MRHLREEEKSKVSSTLQRVVDGKQVSGICVYGSQVAGYARKDSDYDVLIALRPFRQRIRYYYLKGEVDCSALVVDPRFIERDCGESTYGEFVAGRLLNPFESIVGGDFFSENELEYKKRVILEGLIDAYVEHEEFASELDFELAYFLFEKLKKRAAIYPPVVYSYSKTYGEERMDGNLESSLLGFRRAAAELEAQGLITISGDLIRIRQQKFRGGIFARLLSAASFTTKSIRQYAVHGYAGRVGPIVVGKEVVSKLSRSRSHSKLPDVIRYPKSRLSISEGKLFAESEDWINDLLEYLGVDQRNVRINQKPMGEIYTTSSFYSLDDGSKKISFAVKRFRDVKGMKWGILNLWSLRNADFATNPLTRLFREYRGIRHFRKFGLHTPEVLAVFLSQRMLVTRFVVGKDLSKIQSEYLSEESSNLAPFEKFGNTLAILHNNGYCMGDSKPSNAILCDSDSEIYLADLEQSHPGGDIAWDLAEFIYYSVRFTTREDRTRKIVGAFLEGYKQKSEKPDSIVKASALRYRAPFQAFIAPNVLSAVLRDLRAA